MCEAQELGYAEANPAADIEGYDVQLKVLILANELLDAGIELKDVQREGISTVTPENTRTGDAAGSSRARPGGTRTGQKKRRLPQSTPPQPWAGLEFPAQPMPCPSTPKKKKRLRTGSRPWGDGPNPAL